MVELVKFREAVQFFQSIRIFWNNFLGINKSKSIGDTLTIPTVNLQYRDVDFDIRGICALFRNGATFLPRFFGTILDG
jgi:hypothetical protein